MASTNKTPKLGLNQWAAGDEVMRTDFNADNGKIEGLAVRGTCVSGSYTGDNTENRSINLGFKPKFLVISGEYAQFSTGISFVMPNACYFVNGNGVSGGSYDPPIRLTETGFTLRHPSDYNSSGRTAGYTAFY